MGVQTTPRQSRSSASLHFGMALLAAILAGPLTAFGQGQLSTNIFPSLLRIQDSPFPAAAAAAAAAATDSPQLTPSEIPTFSSVRSAAAVSATDGPTCQKPVVANELTELARALRYNPDLIYEYVHNTIQTIPIYDSLKGALGTLIDGAGTPVDQAELMFVLLQQSCYAPQYAYGRINLTATRLQKWLGVDATQSPTGNSSIKAVLNSFNPTPYPSQSAPIIASADLYWLWITVPINGVTYHFDPAGKIFSGTDGYLTRSSGLGGLASVLGYTQPSFIANAIAGAAGIGTPSLSGLNRANVLRDMAGYAAKLTRYLAGLGSPPTTRAVVGGAEIYNLPSYTPPLSGDTRWGVSKLPYLNLHGDATQYTTDLNVPNVFTKMTLALGYNNAAGAFFALPGSPTLTLNSSAIYGRRLIVTFNALLVPSLLLDGNPVLTASAAAPAGQQLTLRATIVHPHSPGANAINADNLRVTPGPGSIYLIGTGWGGVNRGMIEKHRKLIQQGQQAGLAPDSELVLGENLAMIGFTWIAECARLQQIAGEFAGVNVTWLHSVGIVGLKAVGGSLGPYVDLPLNIVNPRQRVGRTTAASDTPSESSVFFVIGGANSILESGTIEQTQPGATAASTTKLLDQWSQSGPILDLNNPEIAGDDCTAYKSIYRPVLTATYGSSDLARIDGLIGYNASSGACSATTTRVVTPSNGMLSIGQWPGAGLPGVGYLQLLYNAGQLRGVGAIISGGLSGGEPASPVPPPKMTNNQAGVQTGGQYTPAAQNSRFNQTPTVTNVAAAGGGSSAVQPRGGDPVNLVTGAYTYVHQDLSIGNGAFPDALAFTRSYDSALALVGKNTSLIGNGWMHNFDVAASVDSDGFEGMGENSPISGAQAIAALFVLQDILNQQDGSGNPTKPTHLVIIAAQIETWLMEKLENNVVSVVQAGNSERFAQLAGGTFNPPIGSATVLQPIGNGGYVYRSGSGYSLTFNPTTGAAAGKATSWSNAAGATVNFTYDTNTGSPTLGALLSVVNPATGQQLTLHYTGAQLTSVDDGTGRSVGYGYDAAGNEVTATDPLGQTTRFSYAGFGQIQSIFYPTHPGQPFVTIGYDSLGRSSQQIDANGNVTTAYIAGTRAELVDPAGTSTVNYFTPRGRISASIEGLGSPTINARAGNLTTSTFDGLDRVLTTTAPEGNSVAYTYDANSNPLTITASPKPAFVTPSLTTTYTYVTPVAALPTFETVQSVTDPLGLVTTSAYDGFGNPIAVVADAGRIAATSRFDYDAQGRLTAAVGPTGTAMRNAYDARGNLVSVLLGSGTDCMGGKLCLLTKFGYDAVGNVVSTTDANGNISTGAFDALRRPLSVVLPSAAPGALTTATTYDPDGRVLQTVQSTGGRVIRSTSATYTLTGKPATTTDPNGNVITTAYDAADRVSQVVDGMRRITRFSYDPLSRITQTFNPGIQAAPLRQYTYTANGKLGSLTDGHLPTGNVTSFGYDGFDRPLTTTYPGGTKETLSYDADGNVRSRQTRKGDTIAFGYDTLNRRTSKIAPGEPTVTMSYDPAGRVLSVSDDSAALSAVPTGPASYAVGYVYDAQNRLTGATWPNVPAAAVPAAGSVTISHSYNAADQRSGQTVSDRAWLLYPATVASTISYTPNALDQYSQVASVTPTYDGNGNLTFDGTFTYGYDAESRLTSIKQGATAVASYAYDAQGRRKTRTVGGTTTVYVTDADNREVVEYAGSGGAVQRWHAFGLGPDEVLNRMEVAGGTRVTLIPDIQGSIIASVDGGTGAVTRTGYLAFGENAADVSGGFRYTGRRLDPETAGSAAEPSGLYYYRARMYSPALGRFLQPDPVGLRGGDNLYAYVGNDPLNATDSSGEFANFLIGALIGGGVDAAIQLYLTGTYDYRQGLAATAAGALTGGASAVIGRTLVTVGGRAIANAAVGAGANAAQTTALNAIRGTNDSVQAAAILGGAFGAAGSAVGDAYTGISAARSQASFDALSTADKLRSLNFGSTNNLHIGAASPAAVATANVLSNAIGASTGLVPGTSIPSLIPSANGFTGHFSSK